MKYREPHMKIDNEEQEAPKDDHTNPSSSIIPSSDHREESIEPKGPVDPSRDVAMTKKRPTWIRDTFCRMQRDM